MRSQKTVDYSTCGSTPNTSLSPERWQDYWPGTELRGFLAPRFVDSDVELAYQLQVETLEAPQKLLALRVLGTIAVLESLHSGIDTDNAAWVHRCQWLGLAATCLLFQALVTFFADKAGAWCDHMLRACVACAVLVSCLTAGRWAALLGLEAWRPGSVTEGSSLYVLTAIFGLSTFIAKLTPRFCLCLVNVVVAVHLAAYFVFAGSAGFPEPACLVEKGGAARHAFYNVMVAVELYLIGIASYAVRRSQDVEERLRFGKQFEQDTRDEFTFAVEHRITNEKQDRDYHIVAMASKPELFHHSVEMKAMVSGTRQDSNLHTDISESRATVPSMMVCKWISGGTVMTPHSSMSSMRRSANLPSCEEAEELPRDLRVPQPTAASKIPAPPAAKPLRLGPNAELATIMAGKTADWARIRKMAEQVRSDKYCLKTFFEDCLASFPELGLFHSGSDDQAGGRSAADEYQRTIGALFTLYWLLRLDQDGKAGFCYGVDDEWRTLHPDAGTSQATDTPLDQKLFVNLSPEEKRRHFLLHMVWSSFEKLVADAGCAPGAPGCTEMVMAILCLTAFHDIMKVESLRPKVQREHAPYYGYQAGDDIHDHDMALSYVLEHFPELLPSYDGLPAAGKNVVLFSQGKMNFNHGWFVQAEAPPGAMLSTFKAALEAGATPTDIGFYFFHWLTDLAGAEATPLGGAEKFVLKFPHRVLTSFLWSMPYLGRLAVSNETSVVETYLEARWREVYPSRAVPQDATAVARMRLTVMAQGENNAAVILDQLPENCHSTLVVELARTGCLGQRFSTAGVHGGPALLVYYGPALMQQNKESDSNLLGAMCALAKVYQAGRALWPLAADQEGTTVTIQVGDLKSKTYDEIIGAPAADARRFWTLVRHNNREGAVVLQQPCELHALREEGTHFALLDMNPDVDSSDSILAL